MQHVAFRYFSAYGEGKANPASFPFDKAGRHSYMAVNRYFERDRPLRGGQSKNGSGFP